MSRIGWKNGGRRAAFAKRVKRVQNDAMCVRAGTVALSVPPSAEDSAGVRGDCGLRVCGGSKTGIVSRLPLS